MTPASAASAGRVPPKAWDAPGADRAVRVAGPARGVLLDEVHGHAPLARRSAAAVERDLVGVHGDAACGRAVDGTDQQFAPAGTEVGDRAAGHVKPVEEQPRVRFAERGVPAHGAAAGEREVVGHGRQPGRPGFPFVCFSRRAWTFVAHDTSRTLTPQQWQSAPYAQDAGSTS